MSASVIITSNSAPEFSFSLICQLPFNLQIYRRDYLFALLTLLDFTYSWFSSKTYLVSNSMGICDKLFIFYLVLCKYFLGLCPSDLPLSPAVHFSYIVSSVAMKLLSTTMQAPSFINTNLL